MSEIRLRPNELREVAAWFRQLGNELDDVHWSAWAAWERLEYGWEPYSRGRIEDEFKQASQMLSRMGDAFYQCAWALEAFVTWVEEADRQASAKFLTMESNWVAIPQQIKGNPDALPPPTAPPKAPTGDTS